MKKLLCALCVLLTLFGFTGCSSHTSALHFKVSSEGKSSFENDLNVTQNNNARYNNSIYLTKNKFIFTSYNPDGRFGDMGKPYVYDLKTGKIEEMLDFDIGNFNNVTVLNNRMYFTCYTDTSSDWGYCLYEYNFETKKAVRIFETPNTVDNIPVVCCDDIIFYLGSKTPQNETDLRKDTLHIMDNGEDRLVKDGITAAYYEGFLSNENGIFFTLNQNYDSDNQITYFADKQGNIEEVKKVLNYEENIQSAEYIDDKIISGKFGDYYILEDEMPIRFTDNADKCGYDYKIMYYLYDVNTNEIHPLTKAQYWFYYC